MSLFSQKLPSRKKNYSDWYNALIKAARLAEPSFAKGSMVMLEDGFKIWEAIQGGLDKKIKETGHNNVYFPMLIPVSLFSREASHIAGFAPECAVVTHYRLQQSGKGEIKVDPDAKLDVPLVVRPTSEAIIWPHFSKWIQSYRDLPILINQWANVVRWEMRTRAFLRTSEFLWQEGHTAHASAEEAKEETMKMLNVYIKFLKEEMAMPVIAGQKTVQEQFSGAEATYTIEGLMQDGKALQLGTSHFLGQNFAKALGVTFSNEKGEAVHPWGTSWGVTTRLMGGLIMTHGDDQGLIIPPKLAPHQVVIIPIPTEERYQEAVLAKVDWFAEELKAAGVRVKLDNSNRHQPGWKFNHYECKGVPLRVVVGSRDIVQDTVELVRRDTHEKVTIRVVELIEKVKELLTAIQENLYNRALQRQKEATREVTTFADFQEIIKRERGFILAHWDGTTATELAIKEATQATIRCIPFAQEPIPGNCIYSGKPTTKRALFAIAY